MIDGIHEAKKHRRREHPEREVENKRTKPKPWLDEEAHSTAADARAEKAARRSRVRAAAKKLAPPGGGVVRASDIAKEAGVPAEGVGQTLRALGYERAPRQYGRAHWIIPVAA